MTIAAGMICSGGIIFGADTEESAGDEMRARVHKIPSRLNAPPAFITGSGGGHFIDTAVERIYDCLDREAPKTTAAVGDLIRNTVLTLYKEEFAFHPLKEHTTIDLLVAVKPEEEKKAVAWSISGTSIHRMRPMEIAGCGGAIRSFADHFYAPDMPIGLGVLAMAQILHLAKKTVQGVGGESYVQWLRDDGGLGGRNFYFSGELETLYEFFLEHGRGLMLSMGDESISHNEFDGIAARFVANLKWNRERLTAKPSTSQTSADQT
jgi:hypothetical protein